MRALALICLSLLFARPVTTDPAREVNQTNREFVVWNVGQGLWTTWVESRFCVHFDMGGEHAPWRDVQKVCNGKQNTLNLSHWDLDHIIYAGRAIQKLKDVCLLTPPLGESNRRKQKLLAQIPKCARKNFEPATGLQRELSFGIRAQGHSKAARSNGDSHVFLLDEAILLPADSTAAEEKIWDRIHPLNDVRLLVLGHHGSRTSTSEDLLLHLRGVRMAVASAREAKYGHPHKEVRDRLKNFGIALLRTEDWGALHFAINTIKSINTQSSAHRPLNTRQISEDPTDGKAYIPCSNCARLAHKLHGRRKH
jgi:competence protein ComEC